MENGPLSLYQLLNETRTALKSAMNGPYWILAEISELKVNYSGHCYLELIDKDEKSDTIRAKVRATIWSGTYRMLQPYFETTAGIDLAPGIRIMVLVTVELHELYGFSLNITDIEPSYTLGEAARQKQEIIDRLVSEGVFEMNKTLLFPDIPKRIAVISSETAAGFEDFMHQMNENIYGYVFHIKLFMAVMQGDETERSIISALEQVYAREDQFDVVVIIRGGGSQAELSSFNNYWVASHICQFPLPVLTGIGHERDETIADMVAHSKLKTPTAVAEYLISKFREADEKITELTDNLADDINERLDFERNRLERLILTFKPSISEKLKKHASGLRSFNIDIAKSSRHLISKHTSRINKQASGLQSVMKGIMLRITHRYEVIGNKLSNSSRLMLEKQAHLISLFEKRNQYLDPFKILERGYSVTYHNGKALRKSDLLPSGTEIETRLHKGRLKSRII